MKQRMLFSRRYLIPLAIILPFVFLTCENSTISDIGQTTPSKSITTRSGSDDIPSGPGETVLGADLQNPYDLTNVNNAYSLLTGTPGNLVATHYYLKFSPVNGEDVVQISDYEDEYDYEFESQPIHYEVLYEGNEGYIDPNVPSEGGFGPEYGAITAEDFNSNNIPDVPFVVLNAMHIPAYESRLTFTAFVISGNEQYYEAVDGTCHPDCPLWPDCLDGSVAPCTVDPGEVEALETIDPFASEPRQDLPGYLNDDALGYFGNVEETSGRIPTPPLEYCPPGCVARLRLSDLVPNTWEWYCDCDIDDGDGGGDDGDPPGFTTQCGCLVHVDDRKPGGRINVKDTQLGDEGVRWIKIKTTKYHWGFIWRSTNTDEEGCWKIDERYRVKRAKVKAVFRDEVKDRLTIRSVRGIRFWNAIFKPVKHTWRLKRENRRWHDLCLVLENSADNTSQAEESWVAATTNNAVHEYYDDHSSLPNPGHTHILIHTISDMLYAAPMFIQTNQDLLPDEVGNWLSSYDTPFVPPLSEFWHLAKADVFLYFGNERSSDQRKLFVYHEMAHVSQYAMVGPQWWKDYVRYIWFRKVFGEPIPYGDGTGSDAGLAELTEGMAESIGFVMADMQYGLSHNNGIDFEADRYINDAEKLTFWLGTFIPEGLFFDLLDINGTSPATVTVSEVSNITDLIGGFSFEQQIGVYSPAIRTIQGFRDAFYDQVAQPAGINEADYLSLFSSYNQ